MSHHSDSHLKLTEAYEAMVPQPSTPIPEKPIMEDPKMDSSVGETEQYFHVTINIDVVYKCKPSEFGETFQADIIDTLSECPSDHAEILPANHPRVKKAIADGEVT